jgi:hypothetical protein
VQRIVDTAVVVEIRPADNVHGIALPVCLSRFMDRTVVRWLFLAAKRVVIIRAGAGLLVRI